MTPPACNPHQTVIFWGYNDASLIMCGGFRPNCAYFAC
uniref:Uncharacterized protein n=1 Tax=Lepeophtheirus salmonis TaxID=72036 RepID=A0A0K2UGW1_LEPSM